MENIEKKTSYIASLQLGFFAYQSGMKSKASNVHMRNLQSLN